jgi:hypothetical protein
MKKILLLLTLALVGCYKEPLICPTNEGKVRIWNFVSEETVTLWIDGELCEVLEPGEIYGSDLKEGLHQYRATWCDTITEGTFWVDPCEFNTVRIE